MKRIYIFAPNSNDRNTAGVSAISPNSPSIILKYRRFIIPDNRSTDSVDDRAVTFRAANLKKGHSVNLYVAASIKSDACAFDLSQQLL